MHARWIGSVAFGFVVACGGAQSPEDQHLTADEYDEQAQREDEAADDHEAQMRGAVFYGEDIYNPSDAHACEAHQHRERAQICREIADRLRAFEEAECARFPADSRASCPLLLDLESVENIEGGVRLTFSNTREIEPIIDHLRCHIAFAAAQGTEGIDSCALYVPGSRVEVNLNVVDLTTTEGEYVEELRRRVAVQAPPDQ